MRAEKQNISGEYASRLNKSPFFIVVDYRGLKVGPITELRKRLLAAGAEMHVVKNSLFRLAVKEAGVADLAGSLAGQLAVVTGQKDVSAAAKVVKRFSAEFEKPKIRFGYLKTSASNKPMFWRWRICRRWKSCAPGCWAFLMPPATKLAVLLKTPANQLARVLQARVEKAEAAAAPAALTQANFIAGL